MSGSANVTPQIDPADEGSLPGVIRAALNQHDINFEDCLPATVISYDRNSNKASVQISLAMVTSENTLVKRNPIASVPVLVLGCHDFLISFPLKSGSKGWLKATDRDMSLFLQSGVDTYPNTARLHSFSDSWFIPDAMMNFTIAAEDMENMTIQNNDGSIKIALWPDRIRITTPIFQVKSPVIQFSTDPVVTSILP